jgi:energy-coupling factor transporter ATP-binding protein EcfA2
MRYFNTHGPVNETEHYVVPRTELLTDLVAQIERGKYFTIYAPRQMGKTTFLHRLADILRNQQDYLPITLDFEKGYGRLSIPEFLNAFRTEFGRGVLKRLQATSAPQVAAVNNLLASEQEVNFFGVSVRAGQSSNDFSRFQRA